ERGAPRDMAVFNAGAAVYAAGGAASLEAGVRAAEAAVDSGAAAATLKHFATLSTDLAGGTDPA
ncbi:MAG: anthranilate phosphoribosyltransferase, partial [Solirubrobacterales bacterium]|nr:anthranilate phosphoribosyltransferase [Solirubrobacterales bacterium]